MQIEAELKFIADRYVAMARGDQLMMMGWVDLRAKAQEKLSATPVGDDGSI